MFNRETNKYEGFIYEIYNSADDKSYIGQTTITVEKRWKRHIQTSKRCLELYFYEFIRYYGEDKFSVNTLECVSCDTLEELHQKLDELEIYYIDYYNTLIPNGYNVSNGGCNPPVLSKGSIYQFDLKGNLLNVYDNTIDASNKTGFCASNIGACCNGNLKSAYGYYWSRKPVVEEEIIEYFKVNVFDKMVKQYDLNGNKIREYNSYKEASNFTNIPNGDISACCRGIQLSAGNYVWRYYNDSFDTYRTPKNKKKYCKMVMCIETGMTFESVAEAAKYCGVTSAYMSRVCTDGRLLNGLHFKRIEVKQNSEDNYGEAV